MLESGMQSCMWILWPIHWWGPQTTATFDSNARKLCCFAIIMANYASLVMIVLLLWLLLVRTIICIAIWPSLTIVSNHQCALNVLNLVYQRNVTNPSMVLRGFPKRATAKRGLTGWVGLAWLNERSTQRWVTLVANAWINNSNQYEILTHSHTYRTQIYK